MRSNNDNSNNEQEQEKKREENGEESSKNPMKYYGTCSFKVKEISLKELKESFKENNRPASHKISQKEDKVDCKRIKRHRQQKQRFLVKTEKRTNIRKLESILPKQAQVELNVNSEVYKTKKSPSPDYIVVDSELEEEVDDYEQQIADLKTQLENEKKDEQDSLVKLYEAEIESLEKETALIQELKRENTNLREEIKEAQAEKVEEELFEKSEKSEKKKKKNSKKEIIRVEITTTTTKISAPSPTKVKRNFSDT